MNPFEDLVPGASGNPFEDLVPSDPFAGRLGAMGARVGAMQPSYASDPAPSSPFEDLVPTAPPPAAAGGFADLAPGPMREAAPVMPTLTQELDGDADRWSTGGAGALDFALGGSVPAALDPVPMPADPLSGTSPWEAYPNLVLRGAAETGLMGARGLEGIGQRPSDEAYAFYDEYLTIQPGDRDTAQDLITRIQRSAMTPARKAGLTSAVVDTVRDGSKRGTRELGIDAPIDSATGERYAQAQRDLRLALPASGEQEQSLLGQVARGFGSTAAFLPFAAIPGGIYAAGALAGAGEANERAFNAGASPQDQATATTLGVVPGALDALSIDSVIRGVTRTTGAAGWLRSVLLTGLRTGAIEGTTEGVQQAAQNVIARVTYDENAALAEGVPENALVGFLVGGGLGMAGGAFSRSGSEAAAPALPTAGGLDPGVPRLDVARALPDGAIELPPISVTEPDPVGQGPMLTVPPVSVQPLPPEEVPGIPAPSAAPVPPGPVVGSIPAGAQPGEALIGPVEQPALPPVVSRETLPPDATTEGNANAPVDPLDLATPIAPLAPPQPGQAPGPGPGPVVGDPLNVGPVPGPVGVRPPARDRGVVGAGEQPIGLGAADPVPAPVAEPLAGAAPALPEPAPPPVDAAPAPEGLPSEPAAPDAVASEAPAPAAVPQAVPQGEAAAGQDAPAGAPAGVEPAAALPSTPRRVEPTDQPDTFTIDGQRRSAQEAAGLLAREEVLQREFERRLAAEERRRPPRPAFIEANRTKAEAARSFADELRAAVGGTLASPPAPSASPPAPSPADLGERVIRSDTSITPAGTDVPVRYAVVELDSLVPSQTDDGAPNPAFTGEQPRDRTRAASRAQVAEIAAGLDLRRLSISTSTADGAPLIGRDGMVDSGNGRVLAMRRAYNEGLPSAERYRAALAAEGYPVEGMRRPVLVRINDAPAEQRAQIAAESNQRSTLAMSTTEQAMADAKSVGPILSTYRGGELTAAANRDFVRRFIDQVVGAGDRSGMMGTDGALSQPGIRRIQSALLAAAYGDAQLVETLTESADSDIKAIGGALVDAAPAWAQMVQEGQSGQIDPDLAGATPDLLEAVRLVQRARNEGQQVGDLVAQVEMFSGRSISPEGELFLRLMFRDERFRQQRGRAKIAMALNFYAEEARKAQPGPGLFGDEGRATASGVLEKARTNADREQSVRGQQLDLPRAGGEEGGGRGEGVPAPGRADGRRSTVQPEDGARDPGTDGPAREGEGAAAGEEVAPQTKAGERSSGPVRYVRVLEDTPLAQQHRAEWQRKTQAIVDRILGPGRITAATADRIERQDAETGADLGGDVGGIYNPVRQAIWLSLAARPAQIEESAGHEIMHALYRGLITPEEQAMLDRAATANGWVTDWIRDQYGQRYWTEEAIAFKFQRFVGGELTRIPAVDALFRKILRALAAIREMVRSTLGYDPDWRDLFVRMERGDLAGRPFRAAEPGQGPMEGGTAAQTPEPEAMAQVRQQRERSVLDAIRDGQPIDRIMRLPFRAIGGINERGEWKAGLRLTGWGAKVVTEKTLDPDGPLAWLNPAIEKARAGLIDRYGQDPAYTARDRARQNEETRLAMDGLEVVRGLVHSGMDANEAKVLQSVLTGEAVGSAEWQKVAAPIRAAIDEMGADAVALGLVSPESYARNKGAYLNRSYIKHEVTPEGGKLGKVAQNLGRSQRAKLIGSELKGRGIFIEIDADQVDPVHRKIGDMIKVLDDQRPDTTGKVKNWARAFVPAGQATPAKYDAWTDKGTWEVRQTKPGKVTLWRDYTKAERVQMGEILDARYTIAKTFYLMAHDIATGRFYKDIAANPEWSTGLQPPEGTWLNAREANIFAQLATDVEWVKVPDTAIEGTGGVKKWGALAGRYVRSEIWRDINQVAAMANRNAWDAVLTQWKLNKTARSPVTHMNNVMSNLTFMDMNDVRMQDLVSGARSYMARDQDFKDAEANGAFGGGFVGAEIKREVLEPILKEIEEQATGKKSTGIATRFLNQFGAMGKFLAALGRGVKAFDDGMLRAYRAEDDVFRMALYKRRLAMGDSPLAAAEAAREVFLDYDIRAPWVNAARRTALPFIAYTYRAAPGIAKAIATKPWKLAKYAALAQLANYAAYALWPGDEDEERRNLRKDQRGYTWIGAPRMLRLWTNSDGDPTFLDIRRFIPAGDVFDLNQGSSAIPLPSWLQLGGPLSLGAELMLNRSNFTGKNIVEPKTDDARTSAGKIGDYLWKSWMPSAFWIPGSWYQQKIIAALGGARDPITHAPLDPLQALVSSFGIKVGSVDLNQAKYYRHAAYSRIEMELSFLQNRIIDDFKRKAISASAYRSGLADIAAKQKKAKDDVADILSDRKFMSWLGSFEGKKATTRARGRQDAKREAGSP